MNQKILLALFAIILLLAACAPESANDLAAPTIERRKTATPALATVEPSPLPSATNTALPEPTETIVVEAEETAEAGDVSNEGEQVVTPVSVDLGELTPAPTVIGTPQEAPRPGSPGATQDELEQRLVADLAARLDIAESLIYVFSREELDWPDGGIGCPDPNYGYIMVITPGFKIVLVADGEQYTYHTNGGRSFVLCGENGVPIP